MTTAQEPTPVEMAKLNMLGSGAVAAASAVVIAIDGAEMHWRVGGTNGAPAAYFAYGFGALAVVWLGFAVAAWAKVRGQA